MTGVFAALCVACACLLALPSLLRFLQHVCEVARVIWKTRSVPGPPCLPVLGCVPTFLAMWDDMHGELLDLLQRYGTTFRWRVFDRVVLVVLDPDDVQVVCTHPALFSKSPAYRLLEAHLGKGLVTMDGPAYRRHRKAISPSLHPDVLRDFVAAFARNAEAVAEDRLAAHADAGRAFDAALEFGALANATVLETVISSSVADDGDVDSATVAEVLGDASHQIMWRATRPWWESDLLFRLCPRHGAFSRSAAALDSMVSRVLRAKADDVARGVPPPPRRRMTFLDHVLRSEGSATLSLDELRDELKTFLFAGSTTSMDFLALVALALTIYPDVQARVQEELDEVFGAPDSAAWRPVSADDLAHLEYTERVLREVLRFAPPAALLFRRASADVLLPSGTLVPRGCVVSLVPAGTHRLATHYPDPLRFDPDRFLPERSRGRHPYAYIPFSAGHRSCVGQRYAVLFAKTAVATLLRRYTFLPREDGGGPRHLGEVRVEPGVTISVRGGAMVRVRRRTAAAHQPS